MFLDSTCISGNVKRGKNTNTQLHYSSICIIYSLLGELESHPEWSDTIQPGLDKLGHYENRLTDTHLVAMGKFYLI